jgi:hypothetical protein
MFFTFKSFFGKTFKLNKDGNEQLEALLSPALIESSEIGLYCNSLATGASKLLIRRMLKKRFEITNETELYSKLNRYYYHDNGASLDTFEFASWVYESLHIFNADLSKTKALLEKRIEEGAVADKDYMNRYETFCENVNIMIGKGIIQSPKEMLSQPFHAYYYALTITIVRMSNEMGLISDVIASAIIASVYEQTIKEYRSWKQFAIGYLVGRAAFSDLGFEHLASCAVVCLDDKESPWHRHKIFRSVKKINGEKR